jgi:hypothetical protein
LEIADPRRIERLRPPEALGAAFLEAVHDFSEQLGVPDEAMAVYYQKEVSLSILETDVTAGA